MERIKNYLFLHLSVVIFSLTGVFSKLASAELNKGGHSLAEILQNLLAGRGLLSPMFFLFLFLMFLDCFVYAICWQKIIKNFALNIGYANRSVYLVWSQVWAVLIFHEELTVRNVIGMLIVLAGVVTVSLGAEQKERK